MQVWEWIIVAAVVLVLFGGSQIPKLARSLGQAQKEFKQGLSDGAADDAEEKKPAEGAGGLTRAAEQWTTAGDQVGSACADHVVTWCALAGGGQTTAAQDAASL